MGRVFRKYGADNDRIWTLIAAALAMLLAAAVWLHLLQPRTLDVAIAALLAGALFALWKARAALGWRAPLPVLIALCRLLPFPWSGAAATLLLALFLALSRQKIADALLPVRAYFIRRRAGRQ